MKSPEGWPKLKRDWNGLRVRARRELSSRGGTRYPIGTLLVITGYYCGCAVRPADPGDKSPGMSRVNPGALELVKE